MKSNVIPTKGESQDGFFTTLSFVLNDKLANRKFYHSDKG